MATTSTSLNNAPASCKWGDKELTLYRVHRQPTSACQFFDCTEEEIRPPQWPHPEYADILHYKDPTVYTARSAGADKVYELLVLLRDMHVRSLNPTSSQVEHNPLESLTVAAAKEIFQLIGLNTRGKTMVRNHVSLEFLSMGQTTSITIDSGIYDQSQIIYLLLLTQDKQYETDTTLFAQLVAGAVAGSQHNNAIRERNRKTLLDCMIIPGIIWIRSLPSFYHIKVTQELAEAVRTGTRPLNDTIVPELYPSIAVNMRVYGLWGLRNRAIVIKILENLKDFVPNDDSVIPIGWQKFMTPEECLSLEGQEALRALIDFFSGDTSDESDEVLLDMNGFETEFEAPLSD